ncbi:MAG: hypothetical protein JW808_04190 [Victivallales bacterium]|nr:hypothetical protein [Victivallales bacterium]
MSVNFRLMHFFDFDLFPWSATYNEENRLAALDGNAVLKRYVWGGGVPIAALDSSEPTPYYCLRDANKNVSEPGAPDGSLKAHYEYSPPGIITASDGPYADSNAFRF